jgi:hypothetical protein
LILESVVHGIIRVIFHGACPAVNTIYLYLCT